MPPSAQARRGRPAAALALTIGVSAPAVAAPVALVPAGLQSVDNLSTIVLALQNYESAV